MKSFFEYAFVFCMGASVSTLAYLASPIPTNRDDCKLYKVDQKAVTSFVLKPPTAPEAVCPAAPKCESVAIPEIKSEEPQKADDPPRRKRYRHHRRVRAYWR